MQVRQGMYHKQPEVNSRCGSFLQKHSVSTFSDHKRSISDESISRMLLGSAFTNPDGFQEMPT